MPTYNSPISSTLGSVSRGTRFSSLLKFGASDSNALAIAQENSRSLGVINTSLVAISRQVSTLSSNLSQVASNVQRSSLLDELDRKREVERENKLAQARIREGKESLIEKKIQNALIKPVAKIGSKLSLSLNNVMSYFKTLFVGWLGFNIINNFETYSNIVKGYYKKIVNFVGVVRDNINKIYTFLNSGTDNIVNTLLSISGKIGKAAFEKLIKKPFTAAFNMIKNALYNIPGVKQLLDAVGLGGDDSGNNQSNGNNNILDNIKQTLGDAWSSVTQMAAPAVKGVREFIEKNIPFESGAEKQSNLGTSLNLTSTKIEPTINSSNVFSDNSTSTAFTFGDNSINTSTDINFLQLAQKPEYADIFRKPEKRTKPIIVPFASNEESPPVNMSGTKSTTNIPFISSGDSSNFYRLMSQMTYQVGKVV